MTAPDAITIRRCHAGRAASERGPVGFSSPSRRTNPPIGSQFTVYSVSPNRFPPILGGKPTPNSCTLMPNILAVAKCAASWASTSARRMNTKSSALVTACCAITHAMPRPMTTIARVMYRCRPPPGRLTGSGVR